MEEDNKTENETMANRRDKPAGFVSKIIINFGTS